MTKSTVPLWLLHLLGNALILWLGYYWLGVGESDTAHLLWSVALVLGGVCAALWIHGTSLVFFDENQGGGFTHALKIAGRNLAPLLAVLCLQLSATACWRMSTTSSSIKLSLLAPTQRCTPASRSRRKRFFAGTTSSSGFCAGSWFLCFCFR